MTEVGVHHADDVRGGRAEAGDHGGPQTELAGAVKDLHPVRPGQLVGDLARAVRRVVVDHHELERDTGAAGGIEQPADEFGQPIAFVVGRNDDRQVGFRGRRHPGTIIQASRSLTHDATADGTHLAILGLDAHPARAPGTPAAVTGPRPPAATRACTPTKASALVTAACPTATRGIRSRRASCSSTPPGGACGRASRWWRPSISQPRPSWPGCSSRSDDAAYGGRVGEGAAALFLLLGDPGIQKLGGMCVRAQCETFIALAVTGALALSWKSLDRRRLLAIAGVWLAVAFWLKYNAIVFALPVGLAAVLPAEGRIDWRRAAAALAWLFVGAAVASAAVLLYFAASGALTDLWLATISYNVRYASETYTGTLDVARYLLVMPFGRARVDGLWFVGLLGLLALTQFRKTRMTAVTLAWIAAAVLSIAVNGSRGLAAVFSAGRAGARAGRRRRSRGRLAGATTGPTFYHRHRTDPDRRHLARRRRRCPGPGPGCWVCRRAWRTPSTTSGICRGDLTREAYLARFDRGDGGKFSPLAIDRLAARVREQTTPGRSDLVFGFAAGGVLARDGTRKRVALLLEPAGRARIRRRSARLRIDGPAGRSAIARHRRSSRSRSTTGAWPRPRRPIRSTSS